MFSSEDIQRIITENYITGFKQSFPQLENTSIGKPVAVFDTRKKQQYWLVPLLLKSKVRGTVLFDLNGNLLTHGVLSPNMQDAEKLLDKVFFEQVPDKLLAEVNDFYKEYEISEHFFSFDKSPQKWGWLICLKSIKKLNSIHVFIGPSGWYESRFQPGVEG